MRFTLTLIALVAALTAASATYTVETVPDVHRADRTVYVANPDGILSAQTVEAINTRLENVRRTTTCEPMVVVVDNIEPEDANDFATELFEHWHLGKKDKDNGLLVLVVKDLRRAVIRTGSGLEGVLPDITCGRIIRKVMAPNFSRGDYDAGTAAAVDLLSKILLDPNNTGEYMSTLDDADDEKAEVDDAFTVYLTVACGVALIMLLLLLIKVYNLRGKSDHNRYIALADWKPVYLALTFLGLGIPSIASVPLVLLLSHWRNHPRKCPNCGTGMTKVDEVHDNDYLTPAQDLEEQVGSVDYDVWLCPSCGETDILPYINRSSPMTECENCHARTARLRCERVVTRPTATRAGKSVREYECVNCHHTTRRYRELPPDGNDTAAALGAAVLLSGMGRRGGGFGGGFGGGGTFGGGFGGGGTSGGGASGGW